MLCFRLVIPAALAVGYLVVCRPAIVCASPDVTDRAARFVKDHETRLRPLEVAAALAWWNANTSGKDEDFDKKVAAQNAIDAALADSKVFAQIKELKDKRGDIDDPIAARCVDVIYLTYLEKQVDAEVLKKMVELSNKVEKAFNVFRAKVDGKEMTDSEVRKVLKDSNDSARRQAVWEASKKVGEVLDGDLRALVKLRNQAAVKLGFKNYHALQLYLNEQDGDQLLKLFDELDELTREPFRKAKADIDERLEKLYGIPVAKLMPWHYHDPFFQETPSVFTVDLDKPFEKADLLAMSRKFYDGIGLPIDRVITASDLYEKKGKSPHAFCTDIDREGDVRVLANIQNNEQWMGTMLHELGHSVYSSKNIPRSVPYVVRGEAHILTTEGVAMQFERFSKSRPWIEKMGLKVPNATQFDEAAKKVQRNQLLIFSRWCQVMLRFEKGMYENPQRDLNKLWWDLVEKYQGLHRPEGRNAPDYCSKVHICSAPVDYHNYMMGQLFASQVHHAICRDIYNGADPNSVIYIGDKRVGEFMKKKVFEPGRTVDWRGLTRYATGEDLTPKAFAADFKAN